MDGNRDYQEVMWRELCYNITKTSKSKRIPMCQLWVLWRPAGYCLGQRSHVLAITQQPHTTIHTGILCKY